LGADAALEDLGAREIDTLLVAGTPNWEPLLASALVDQVARLAPGARRIVSVCTGTFALAAGLLDGRQAATHWRHAAGLAREFTDVKVDCDALFVRDDNVFTAAGIAAGIDLALALVGLTAGAYVERVRVEAARTMPEGGDDSPPAVAARAGFGSTKTMRRAFLRELAVTPGAYRSQFPHHGDRRRP
jgi:transcriptional regulator GlxA family with amidase domain